MARAWQRQWGLTGYLADCRLARVALQALGDAVLGRVPTSVALQHPQSQPQLQQRTAVHQHVC